MTFSLYGSVHHTWLDFNFLFYCPGLEMKKTAQSLAESQLSYSLEDWLLEAPSCPHIEA